MSTGITIRFFIFLFCITITTINAQNINVGGVLTTSQTWTNQFTYIVTEDLVIPEDVVLTIQPGVLVKVNFNRGITITGGSLISNGNQTDTISFIPNYTDLEQDDWKWKGLTIKNSNIENASSFQYTLVDNAEIAINIEESRKVLILNSEIKNSQNTGISITNSSNISIQNCIVENNNYGIKISVDPTGLSSNNLVNNCLLRNLGDNISVLIDSKGKFQYNIFSYNIISSANNGISIKNSGNNLNVRNTIESNYFINNGGNIGYGLYLDLDSTTVINNVFWQNNISVFTYQKGDNNRFSNNNFYQNSSVFLIGDGSTGNEYNNNTFSLNSRKYFDIREISNVKISQNNILHTQGQSNIVSNFTNRDFLIPSNYWGTTDTALINKLIYDKTDNPVLGKLIYEPYLPVLDSSNPISAPYQVIKQLVNGNVRISWCVNPEPDLAGYKIYFGDYADYRFTDNLSLGKDTVFFFQSDVSIDDVIAVSAYDSEANGSNDMTDGNESPYAFAQIYPFAGNDTIICTNSNEVSLTDVTIPFSWQTLFWTSSGDGYFNNNEIQFPTYFPGDNDIQNGNVIISLNVVPDENNPQSAGSDTLIDSFTLTIFKSPEAFAGNDTILFADSQIELIDAVAQNYNSISWLSEGDGFFSNDTIINPIYVPGESDNQQGFVKLWLNAYSQCDFAKDSIIIGLIPYFSVEGKLWSNQRSVNPGVVIAFNETDDGVRAVQMENTTTDGSFKFSRMAAGNYYLYAVPDTSSPENNAPCYYVNKLRWQSAYVLPVFEDVYDIDIQLPSIDYVLPEGEASISGHMALPAINSFSSNIYCNPWFGDDNRMYCQDGYSNATVLLFNKDKSVLLDYTLTNNLGNFYFHHLPYGEYIIEAEKVGLLSVPSPVIDLSPEHKNETGILLEMDYKKISAYLTPDAPPNKTVAVFPNPASSFLNIPLTDETKLDTQIKIFDIFGNCVQIYEVPTSSNIDMMKCNIADLPSGIYFGQIGNASKTIFFKFMKR